MEANGRTGFERVDSKVQYIQPKYGPVSYDEPGFIRYHPYKGVRRKMTTQRLAFSIAAVLPVFLAAGLTACVYPQSLANPSPSPSANTALISQGQQLFVANCQVCHGTNATGLIGPNIQGKTATDVTWALQNVAAMSSLSGTITTSDIQALGAYLSSL